MAVRWASLILRGGLGGDLEGLGATDDLIVDLSESNVDYVLMEVEGNLQAVPFQAIDLAIAGDQVVIEPAFDVALLTEAPTVTPDLFGDTLIFDETWDDDLETFWADAGYPVGLE